MDYSPRFFQHETIGVYLDMDNQFLCFVIYPLAPSPPKRLPLLHIPLLKGETVYPAASMTRFGEYVEGHFGLDIPQQIEDEIEMEKKANRIIEMKND